MATPARPPEGSKPVLLPRVASALFLLFVFLLGVKLLGSGFRLLGEDLIQGFFAATENPFVGLVVGLLATTLVQSSSVTTSMVVAMVAAPENPLPLANAIPMVMGANIGTTVTSTIVSLAHLGRRDEFERAFPVAVCHDIFNYLSVLILLPLEMTTGFLRRTATILAKPFSGMSGVDYESPLDTVLNVGLTPVRALVELATDTDGGRALVFIALSALFIFFALFFLVKVLRVVAHTRVETAVHDALGQRAVVSIFVGIAVTIMVQSSSITTSVLVPLAGAGLLRLEQAFPVTIGANIGTTVTALLAAMAVSGPNASAGLEIALVHLLFNLSGLLVVYPVERIRRVPLDAARLAARWAVRSRKMTVLFIAVLFYGLPSLFIAIAQWLR